MPIDSEKWEEEMIAKGLMKDKDGYYHYTKQEEPKGLWIALDALRKEKDK